LGLMAAQLLLEQGHRVVLHARNDQRAKETLGAAPGAKAVVVGNLANGKANDRQFAVSDICPLVNNPHSLPC
jgi:NAD(P)-dependent dehydrogenase (short-subunit alcohol dehydrogenase family)